VAAPRTAGEPAMQEPHLEIDPKTWRRVYVATIAYGVLTIAALWWFTSVFG
jgi:ABC-type uncharacterized transport system permease subunit